MRHPSGVRAWPRAVARQVNLSLLTPLAPRNCADSTRRGMVAFCATAREPRKGPGFPARRSVPLRVLAALAWLAGRGDAGTAPDAFRAELVGPETILVQWLPRVRMSRAKT
jgi:hypothetical protein